MRLLILSTVLLPLFFSCSNKNDIQVEKNEELKDTIVDSFEERSAEIEKYTAILFSDSLNTNDAVALQLLAAYEDFIQHHSFESISKEYQFRAGELAKALNKPHVAIRHFNGLLERAPNHERAPLALFYKAMVIGDLLHENDNAKRFYQEFIDKYPNHPLVPSAKESIKLQGKSLEDIVKEFEKKNAS